MREGLGIMKKKIENSCLKRWEEELIGRGKVFSVIIKSRKERNLDEYCGMKKKLKEKGESKWKMGEKRLKEIMTKIRQFLR